MMDAREKTTRLTRLIAQAVRSSGFIVTRQEDDNGLFNWLDIKDDDGRGFQIDISPLE